LKGYFDTIPHDQLMKCLRMRITDRSVLTLIERWLQSPVVETDEEGRTHVSRPTQGTPQGGVISPLLANIYLHWFEKAFHRPDGPATWAKAQMVRYADDFLILARYQSRRLIRWVESQLEGRFKLTINRQKTRVVDLKQPRNSVDFLGFTFRYDRDRLGRGHRYLNVFPSKKALKRVCEKVRELTGSSRCFMPIPFLIGDLRRVLRGWRNYFAHGYPRHAFRRLNWYVVQRLHGHLKRRSQRRYRPPDGVPLTAHLQALGWQSLRAST
jgi:RNA-directed DNA polymerase